MGWGGGARGGGPKGGTDIVDIRRLFEGRIIECNVGKNGN